LNRDDLHSIYRLRELIEPEIAGRASSLLSSDDVAELETLLAGLSQHQEDIEVGWELHRLFHVALLRPAATAWDMRTLEMLWDAGERYVRHSFDKLATEPSEPRRRTDAHRVLLRAVTSGDALAASAAMREHLLRNEEIAIRGITDDPSAQTA
jgi:DNA-binding GntR family transcriptional regulator